MEYTTLNFRAWHKVQKKMFAILGLDLIHKTFVGHKDLYGGFDEIEIMQSTGLKDKNGKEIFVGDIIRIDVEYETLFAEIKFGTKEYKWSTNEAHGYYVDFGTQELKSEMLFWIKKYGVEVVGNIYENGDLLCKK